jgi:hypothetical protein
MIIGYNLNGNVKGTAVCKLGALTTEDQKYSGE